MLVFARLSQESVKTCTNCFWFSNLITQDNYFHIPFIPLRYTILTFGEETCTVHSSVKVFRVLFMGVVDLGIKNPSLVFSVI